MKNRSLQPEKIERVVVRGANWVGDAVMTIPALRELRRLLPHAHLTLATRSWAEGIFADADFIDDLLGARARGRGTRAFLRETREWRARRFDLAILLPNSFAPALVAAVARIPFRMGYATDGRGALLTHPLAVPTWRDERHEVFYYLNVIRELERYLTGSEPSAQQREPRYELEISNARKDKAREFLLARGARPDDRPLVALCPGSTNSRAKRWPADRFAALADRLIREAGADVALVGAREEAGVTAEVVRQMRERPLVLTGETDLAQTVAVLSLAEAVISNDTGPAHIAAALRRPTFVIFGPTNPMTTRPFSPTAEVIRQPPDCAPCMLRDCPIDHRCMTAISADEVFARARAALPSRAPESRIASDAIS